MVEDEGVFLGREWARSPEQLVLIAADREGARRALGRAIGRWEGVIWHKDRGYAEMDEEAEVFGAPVSSYISEPRELERGWQIYNDCGGGMDESYAVLLVSILEQELRREGVCGARLAPQNEYDSFSDGPGAYLRQWGDSVLFAPLLSVRSLIDAIQRVMPSDATLLFGLPHVKVPEVEGALLSVGILDADLAVVGKHKVLCGANTPAVACAPVALESAAMGRLWQAIGRVEHDGADLAGALLVVHDERVLLTAASRKGPRWENAQYAGFRVSRHLHDDALNLLEATTRATAP